MHLGTLRIVLHIPQSRSLKSKRQVLNQIKDKLRNKFNISLAEIDDNDLWQRATLGVAAVTNSHQHLEQILSQIENAVAANPNIVLVDVERDFY
jgi:hypothetical protein